MDENDFVNCSECGEIIPRRDNFCKHCGQKNQESNESDRAVYGEVYY